MGNQAPLSYLSRKRVTPPCFSEFPLATNGYRPGHVAALLWAHVPKLGIKRLRHILQHFEGEALWQLFWVPPEWAKTHFSETFHQFPESLFQSWREKQALFRDKLPALLKRYESEGVRWLSLMDEDYPPLLKQIHDAPNLLFFRGNFELLTNGALNLSVVGAREPSAYALAHAQHFVEAMAGQPLNIVSGLAVGVDSAAHRAALVAKLPTVAVLAGGLDTIYPASNQGLADEILKTGGLLLSEMPLGVPPAPKLFPRRNRIIVGLSQALWLVEASQRSGSMVSARLALEENRDIGVLPGQVNNPKAAGSLKLLREGAIPILAPEHLLEMLGLDTSLQNPVAPLAFSESVEAEPLTAPPSPKPEANAAKLRAVTPSHPPHVDHPLLKVLAASPQMRLSVDELHQQAEHEAAGGNFFAELTLLELNGQIQRGEGNIITLVAS